MSQNRVTIHINNMAYTVSLEDDTLNEIRKYLDVSKNNDVKNLLAAYIGLSREHSEFKKDLEKINEKLSNYK